MGLGDAHSGGAEAIDRIDLGALPRLFGLRPAVAAAALVHRALLSAAPDPAALGVLRTVLEATELGVLVDLRDAQVAPRAHDVYVCFFAAHQRPKDLFDDAVVEQGLEALRYAHLESASPADVADARVVAPRRPRARRCSRTCPA